MIIIELGEMITDADSFYSFKVKDKYNVWNRKIRLKKNGEPLTAMIIPLELKQNNN